MSTDKKQSCPNILCCSNLLRIHFCQILKANCLFKSDILHTNLCQLSCQFYLQTIHKHLTSLNLHFKQSSLRNFCKIKEFRKLINRIYKVRFQPNPKLFLSQNLTRSGSLFKVSIQSDSNNIFKLGSDQILHLVNH